MHFRPLPGLGLELQPAASLHRAFFHAQQSQARPAHSQFPDGSHIKSNAMIAHAQMQIILIAFQFHGHTARFGMANNVGQRFLGNPKTLGFDH